MCTHSTAALVIPRIVSRGLTIQEITRAETSLLNRVVYGVGEGSCYNRVHLTQTRLSQSSGYLEKDLWSLPGYRFNQYKRNRLSRICLSQIFGYLHAKARSEQSEIDHVSLVCQSRLARKLVWLRETRKARAFTDMASFFFT